MGGFLLQLLLEILPSVGQSSFCLYRVPSHSLTHLIQESLKEVMIVPILEMGSCSLEREERNQARPQSQEEQNLNATLLLSSSELSCPRPHTPPHTGPKPSTALTRALKLKHKLQHQSTPPDTAPLKETERQRQRQGQIQMRSGRVSGRGVAISPGNLDS